jgi:hypothetical protein
VDLLPLVFLSLITRSLALAKGDGATEMVTVRGRGMIPRLVSPESWIKRALRSNC